MGLKFWTALIDIYLGPGIYLKSHFVLDFIIIIIIILQLLLKANFMLNQTEEHVVAWKFQVL
jgi:hypothetical protein